MLQRAWIVVVGSLLGCASASGEPPPPEDVCPPSHSICEGDIGADFGKADDSTVRTPWGTAIEVVGRVDAVAAVLADLDTMAASAEGAQVLADLERAAAEAALSEGADDDESGRVIVRARDEPDPSPLECARTMFDWGWLSRAVPPVSSVDESGRAVIGEAGQRVPPSKIRVFYNRNCQESYEDGAPCFAPWFLLLHELRHATHGMSGTVLADIPDASDPMPGGSNHEEAWTIGRGPYLGDAATENAVRVEIGFPVRDSHGWLCGPRP